MKVKRTRYRCPDKLRNPIRMEDHNSEVDLLREIGFFEEDDGSISLKENRLSPTFERNEHTFVSVGKDQEGLFVANALGREHKGSTIEDALDGIISEETDNVREKWESAEEATRNLALVVTISQVLSQASGQEPNEVDGFIDDILQYVDVKGRCYSSWAGDKLEEFRSDARFLLCRKEICACGYKMGADDKFCSRCGKKK